MKKRRFPSRPFLTSKGFCFIISKVNLYGLWFLTQQAVFFCIVPYYFLYKIQAFQLPPFGQERTQQMITKIRKRDGREVPFNIEKIANAIFKAAQVCGGRDYQTAFSLAQEVASYVEDHCGGEVPTVEFIQDAVEKVLVERGHARTAKEYIL